MTSGQNPAARLFHLGGKEGSDVLLIHGFGSDRFSWVATALGLFSKHRVWAVEMPGHGEAANDVGEGTPQALAAAVAASITELPRPFAVVGHSLGGTVSLHLAQLLGDEISHLTVMAPGGWGSVIDHSFVGTFPDLRTAEETEALLHRLVSRKRLIRPQMVTHVLEMLERPGRRDALKKLAQGILAAPPPPMPDTDKLCVIWGAEDRINTPDYQRLETLHERASVLTGIGHMPHVEAQSVVNGLIKSLLAR